VNIALVGLTRERACGGSKASATYTFSIFDRDKKTRAEIILTDGGFEIIEKMGNGAKVAARLALERLLAAGRDPSEEPIFLRIPYPHAEYFATCGSFHESLDRCDQFFATCCGMKPVKE
jgi:hypothetical protein